MLDGPIPFIVFQVLAQARGRVKRPGPEMPLRLFERHVSPPGNRRSPTFLPSKGNTQGGGIGEEKFPRAKTRRR